MTAYVRVADVPFGRTTLRIRAGITSSGISRSTWAARMPCAARVSRSTVALFGVKRLAQNRRRIIPHDRKAEFMVRRSGAHAGSCMVTTEW